MKTRTQILCVAAMFFALTGFAMADCGACGKHPDAKDAKCDKKEVKCDKKDVKCDKKGVKCDKKDAKDVKKDAKDVKKDAKNATGANANDGGVIEVIEVQETVTGD